MRPSIHRERSQSLSTYLLDQGVRRAQGGLRERPDGLRAVPRAQGARRRLRRRRGLEDAEAGGRQEAQERQARRGHARVAPRDHSLPAGRARASTHRRGRLTAFPMGSRTAAPEDQDSKAFETTAPDGESKCGSARRHIRTSMPRREPADISLPGERRLTSIRAGPTGRKCRRTQLKNRVLRRHAS